MRKLGNLQLLVLMAAVNAGGQATATKIYDRIADVHGKDDTPAFGPIYTTIIRLADKGFLTLEYGTDDQGRQRKLFSVSAEGRTAIDLSLKTVRALTTPAFATG